MADAITLLSSAAHANVATELRGVTPYPAGFIAGGVPLASQVKGNAVDVSAYTLLRLQLSVTAMANRHGFEHGLPCCAALHVALEHRSGVGKPWLLLHQFAPMSELGTQRVVLSAFEGSIRTSHYFARATDAPGTIRDQVAFTFGLAGDALPEAA